MAGLILGQAARTRIVGAHASLGHLIDTWDYTWEPHQAYAHLCAMQASLRIAESVISRAEDRIEEATHG